MWKGKVTPISFPKPNFLTIFGIKNNEFLAQKERSQQGRKDGMNEDRKQRRKKERKKGWNGERKKGGKDGMKEGRNKGRNKGRNGEMKRKERKKKLGMRGYEHQNVDKTGHIGDSSANMLQTGSQTEPDKKKKQITGKFCRESIAEK